MLPLSFRKMCFEIQPNCTLNLVTNFLKHGQNNIIYISLLFSVASNFLNFLNFK